MRYLPNHHLQERSVTQGDQRQCAKCHQWKSLDAFGKRYGRRVGQVQSYCRVCVNDLTLVAYQAQKDRAVKYLGGCCADCGVVYPTRVYDFHHLDPTVKDDLVSKLLHGSWDKVQLELDKCVLLCANCHRLRHRGHNLSYK